MRKGNDVNLNGLLNDDSIVGTSIQD